MTNPHDDLGRPAGPGGDDARLARLLADGLGRAAGNPVDAEGLLAGARRGAVRIRRRRTTAVGLATAVVLVVPGGLVVGQFLGGPSVVTAESGLAGGAATAAADAGGEQDAARQAAEAETPGAAAQAPMVADPAGTDTLAAGGVPAATNPSSPSPPEPLAAAGAAGAEGASRTTGRVVIPDEAMLRATDVPQGMRRPTDNADQSPAPAAAPPPGCGGTLGTLPVAAGSREAVLEQRTGTAASWWLLSHTVRVFPADGAERFLSAGARLDCVSSVSVLLGDDALAGRGRPDSRGRTHWYGVVRVGRVVSEVQVVVPRGVSLPDGEGERLLRLAAERLTTSGLAASAASDPGLA